MSIRKVSPEHQKAVQPAVDLINQQVMEIEQLREALVHVHTELSGIVDYPLHGTVPPPCLRRMIRTNRRRGPPTRRCTRTTRRRC